MDFICFTCGTKFSKQPSDVQNHEHPFCSRRCAAITNNKLKPKRKKQIRNCIICKVVLSSKRTYCDECLSKIKYEKDVGSLTLAEATYHNQQSSNRYARIRDQIKHKYRKNPQPCVKCGYSIHTNICHIKAISTFSSDVLVSVINAPENLIWLCPNCHWEFDHGLLHLEGVEPSLDPNLG